MADVSRRLANLEAEIETFRADNVAQRARINVLEHLVEDLLTRIHDVTAKTNVVREHLFSRPTSRAHDIVEIMERILCFCPPTQLFRLQLVNHAYRSIIQGSPLLQSMMFASRRSIDTGQENGMAGPLGGERIRFNPFLPQRWTKMSYASYVLLHNPDLHENRHTRVRYTVRNDLSAVLDCVLGPREEDYQHLLRPFRNSRGGTYLTQPALPVTVHVAFTSGRNPLPWTRPDVVAVADLFPSSILEMLRMANLIRSSFPMDGAVDPQDYLWTPLVPHIHSQDQKRSWAPLRSPPRYARLNARDEAKLRF